MRVLLTGPKMMPSVIPRVSRELPRHLSSRRVANLSPSNQPVGEDDAHETLRRSDVVSEMGRPSIIIMCHDDRNCSGQDEVG